MWSFVGDVYASQHHTPSWPQELYALGVPPLCTVWVLLLWQADYCEWSGMCGWPLAFSVARPCLVWRLPATDSWGQVMRQLAAEPRGALGLVLAHW